MLNPEAGDVMPGTGGLRKLRFADERRAKGKRGGLRVIYYWWDAGSEFWLFTIFDKDEMSDLTTAQSKALKQMIKHELEARRENDDAGNKIENEAWCSARSFGRTERRNGSTDRCTARQADSAHSRSGIQASAKYHSARTYSSAKKPEAFARSLRGLPAYERPHVRKLGTGTR
jgi:hypothetical protein